MLLPEENLPYIAEVIELIKSKNFKLAIQLIIKLHINNQWDEFYTNKWLLISFKHYVDLLVSDVNKSTKEELLQAVEDCKWGQDFIFNYSGVFGVNNNLMPYLLTEFLFFQQKFYKNPRNTVDITEQEMRNTLLNPQVEETNSELHHKCINAYLNFKQNSLEAKVYLLLEQYLTMYIFQATYISYLKNNKTMLFNKEN